MPRGKRKAPKAAGAPRRAGTAHFNGGRYGKALACFRRARALGDDSAELGAFIAHALQSAGRPAEAIAEFAASKTAPVMLNAKVLPGAERALREALAADPRNAGARHALVEVLRARGQAALSAGDTTTAEALVREALALKPSAAARSKAVDVLRSCGAAHQFAGRLARAAAIFQGLLKENPRDARACMSLAAVMRASADPAKERALLARALLRDRASLARADRFRALMKLGRHKEAVAEAESILDAGPTLNDLRVFWDPWEWDDRRPRSDRLKELRRLERTLVAKAAAPWLHYYRAELLGPEGLANFETIAAFPRERYGWMFSKAGLAAHCEGRFDQAVEWFRFALASKPRDWRTHCFLAEALLCSRRPEEAFAELEQAAKTAPPDDKGQVLAWRGAVDLWLGRYEEALVRLEEACGLDAQCAYSWRAAALLKLGRPAEALEKLDDALRRFPRDFEAYVWRGEAKRELGLYAEALADLNEEKLSVPKQEPPIWLWALVNRALVKGALRDRAGLEADFDALPDYFTGYIRSKTGLTDKEALLRAALELGRGFRREEYKQAIWMI